MKATAPIFVHYQYPITMFGFPPAWLFLCLMAAIGVGVMAQLLVPAYKTYLFFGVLFGGLIFIKTKIGGARHSDQVWVFSRVFQFNHKTGFIAAGGKQ